MKDSSIEPAFVLAPKLIKNHLLFEETERGRLMSNKFYYLQFSSIAFSLLFANASFAQPLGNSVPDNHNGLPTTSDWLQSADAPDPSTTIPAGTRLIRPLNQILQEGVNFEPSSNPLPERDRTSPAGTRGGVCDQDISASESRNGLSMIPLIPQDQFGYTTAERPTFLVYVPQTSAQQIILIISENNGQDKKLHSQTFFSIQENPSIVALQPSKEFPSLEVGKTYQMAAVLICGKGPGPNDPAVLAGIQRLPFSHSFEKANELQKADWYAREGIWYDAIDYLATYKINSLKSQNFDNIWSNFLDSVGLSQITEMPIYSEKFLSQNENN